MRTYSKQYVVTRYTYYQNSFQDRKSGYYMRARALYFELPTKDDTNHIAHMPLTNSFSMDRLNSDNLLENANLI